MAKHKIPVVLSSSMVLRETDLETGKEVERVIPRIFHDAGVKFATSTSTSGLAGRFAWYQAACLVRYGMSREDALAAVTRTPAELVGLGDEVRFQRSAGNGLEALSSRAGEGEG